MAPPKECVFGAQKLARAADTDAVFVVASEAARLKSGCDRESLGETEKKECNHVDEMVIQRLAYELKKV
jgi:hypothetical protein